MIDNISPTSDCVFNPIIDSCTGLITYDLPTFSDNCSGTSFEIIGPASGSILPIGTTTINFVVSDASGNSTVCNIDVTNNAQLSVDALGTNALCFNQTSGSATANVTGLNPPFTYQWNTGQTTQQINNLGAGVYSVIVTDNNNCTVNAEVIVDEPNELLITDIIVTDETTPGQSNGTIALTINGGTPPYTTNPDISTGFPGGSYFIEITDANGCMITSQEIIVGTMVSNENVLLEKNIQLYPNPSTGQVFLDFNLPQSMEGTVRIFDATGKMIQENPANIFSQNKIELDALSFANGLYFIQIQLGEYIVMKRFILQKE